MHSAPATTPAPAVDKYAGALNRLLRPIQKKPEQAVHNQCNPMIFKDFLQDSHWIPHNYPQGYAQRIQKILLLQRCG